MSSFGYGYNAEAALTVFPYNGTCYVNCPRRLFVWFLFQSQRLFWEYFDSLTESERECEFAGYEFESQPDKLDACFDAYEWLRNPDWVTPEFFLVDVNALGRPADRW